VELDPEPFQLKVDRAAIVVDRAKLALGTAERNLERAKPLVATGSVSADALQDLEVALAKARLDLRDAELNLRETRKDLADSRIAAPMRGRLIALDVEEGEMVAAATSMSGGTTMGTVADPRKMKVEVEVGELDFPRLKQDMEVEVSGSIGVAIFPRDGDDPDTFRRAVEIVADRVAEGKYAFHGKVSRQVLETEDGMLALSALIFNCDESEVIELMVQKGPEVGAILALTLRESFPGAKLVAARPEEGADPKSPGPAA
jgi:multidrug efflux pump subunit AcrA (membrane-fusion protein)